MMKLNLLLFVIICFLGGTAYAGPIKKCIGADGRVVYTDKGCATKHANQETMHVGEKPRKSTVKYSAIKENQDKEAVAKAKAECTEKAKSFFQNKYSHVKNPEFRFESVNDYVGSGSDLSIKIGGNARYSFQQYNMVTDLVCNCKRDENNVWQVNLVDGKTVSKFAQEKKKKIDE